MNNIFYRKLLAMKKLIWLWQNPQKNTKNIRKNAPCLKHQGTLELWVFLVFGDFWVNTKDIRIKDIRIDLGLAWDMVIQWSVAQDLLELLKSTRLDEVKYVLTEWSKDRQWCVPSQLEDSPCGANN